MPGTRKLGRATDSRNAMLRAMVTYLFENGKIETTVTRAKEVRSMAEKMVTLGKKEDLHSKRQVFSPTSPRKLLLRRSSTRSAPSMQTVTVVIPALSKPACVAATQLRWLSSSWFDLNKNISPSGFREGIFLCEET